MYRQTFVKVTRNITNEIKEIMYIKYICFGSSFQRKEIPKLSTHKNNDMRRTTKYFFMFKNLFILYIYTNFLSNNKRPLRVLKGINIL